MENDTVMDSLYHPLDKSIRENGCIAYDMAMEQCGTTLKSYYVTRLVDLSIISFSGVCK